MNNSDGNDDNEFYLNATLIIVKKNEFYNMILYLKLNTNIILADIIRKDLNIKFN